MALALKLDGTGQRVFVIDSDGECDEGSLWEAALAASKHHLDTLTILLDYNHMQSYASTSEILELEPLGDKWRAFGFAVEELDGHDVAALRNALSRVPFTPGKPSILICHTVKGKGVSFMEGTVHFHGKAPNDEECSKALEEIGACKL